jgi:hypothetical protein
VISPASERQFDYAQRAAVKARSALPSHSASPKARLGRRFLPDHPYATLPSVTIRRPEPGESKLHATVHVLVRWCEAGGIAWQGPPFRKGPEKGTAHEKNRMCKRNAHQAENWIGYHLRRGFRDFPLVTLRK